MTGREEGQLAAAVAAALVAAGYRPGAARRADRVNAPLPARGAWTVVARGLALRGPETVYERRRDRLK